MNITEECTKTECLMMIFNQLKRIADHFDSLDERYKIHQENIKKCLEAQQKNGNL